MTSKTTEVVQGATPLDGLRAEFAKKLEPKRLRKRFPHPPGTLVGEYKIAPKDKVRAAAETQNDEYLLSECLIRVLVEDKDHPSADEHGLVPLAEWTGNLDGATDPIRFDNRLAGILGIPPNTPNEIALTLYEGNDLLLATHVGELAEWSLNTSNEAYQDFPQA